MLINLTADPEVLENVATDDKYVDLLLSYIIVRTLPLDSTTPPTNTTAATRREERQPRGHAARQPSQAR